MTAQTNDQRTGADLTPVTWSVLNISTSHIPRRTALALGEGGSRTCAELWDQLSYTPWHEYGWIIFVSDFSGIRDDHPELAAVLKFAFDHGFDYLQLDADGSVYDGLPTFEWEV